MEVFLPDGAPCQIKIKLNNYTHWKTHNSLNWAGQFKKIARVPNTYKTVN